ncbi:MAG TPA: sigma-54-dependent Fis family transcriptional regulator [Burkholderiaceae bacterium]|nr:sigma-54-dependent Fis family transcriptional regulator [Burkholderiaceae bacterium]
MQSKQQQHIASVVCLAAEGRDLPAELATLHQPDPIIRDSWIRCVRQHGLDPTRMHEAIILPQHLVREHQVRLDEFLRIARHGLETLYRQVAGMGYCVLLTDEHGVTVDFIGDIRLDASLRRAGLYLGSDWGEHHAGTCGVGTAIATGTALTVHQDDHFDATHIPLTCTAAPVFDPLGRLRAILDISALVSPRTKNSQHLALQLVQIYARQIENATFQAWFRNEWILKLDASPEFVDSNAECLVAFDGGARVIGHNRRAQLLLEGEVGGAALGLPFGRFFDARFEEIGRFVGARPPEQRALKLARSGRLLFARAEPPPARWMLGGTDAEMRAAVPAPLAALSGGDAALARQVERAARLVNSPISFLITGETGTGKEHFAKALHAASERRDKPFVAVNCAALPAALIESELFGYAAGSFTGAAPRGKRGLVIEADGGTLFLDEVGDMPLEAQPRLLRVLAEREVLAVGSTRPIKVDLRVIAATHRDLQALVRAGAFRDDLYYRLTGAHFHLPPLRERNDFEWLVQRLLAALGGEGTPTLAPEAMDWLRAWHWPGNLRELRNALEYASAVCSGGYIRISDLPDYLLAAARAAPARGAPTMLPAEAQLLLQYLRAARWNVSVVARQLGVARMTLYRRMKRWGIEKPPPSE